MPIKALKKDIKSHRPIDWFAIVVLISVAFVVAGFLANEMSRFDHDMDAMEADLAL